MQVLAIFDDLDTIILMIPIQILMIGMRWQMFVIIIVATFLIWLGWKKMNSYPLRQDWKSIIIYSIILFVFIEILYRITTHLYGNEGGIHIEILLPAFILGIIIKKDHTIVPERQEVRVSDSISYIFMLLVGISMPLFIGVDYNTLGSNTTSVINQIPMPGWDVIVIHVLIVTFISNFGKLFPLLFYRDRKLSERLAVSVGMFARGEVGAGVLFIAIGYHLGGVFLVVSVLAMSLNLLLTGIFISYTKRLSIVSAKESIAKLI